MKRKLLHNANIITMDPIRPFAEWAILSDGRIQNIGLSNECKRLEHSKIEFIDCRGQTVLPGFIDAHLHLSALVERCVSIDLSPAFGVHSITDIQYAINDRSKEIPPKAWIRGKGYDEYYLSEKRHPTRWDLDFAAPDHPVKITHRSGHAHVLNTKALSLVGISVETGDPPGGLIDRDLITGEPTGLLYEMGEFLSDRIPHMDEQEILKGLSIANQRLLASGITSMQDASVLNDLNTFRKITTWKKAGLCTPRIRLMLGQKGFDQYTKTNAADFSDLIIKEQLSLGAIKVILDETTGELNPSEMELVEMISKFHQAGFQVAMHAIEENAIEAACNAIEQALARIPKSDHRHRIEHCSLCNPRLAQKIASLGITVVTQPSFLYYNGDRYLAQIPTGSLPHLYPIKSLMKNGIPVAGSSDCPVTPLDPMKGMYAAITRKSKSGKIVGQNETISPWDALKMHTINAARAIFEENSRGSLSPGKLADLILLNGNPMKLPSDEIKDVEVDMTIINGDVVWSRKG